MIEIKSQYELIMERYANEKRVTTYSEADNLSMMECLNKGMEDFLHTQKKSYKLSELEMSGIILNA